MTKKTIGNPLSWGLGRVGDASAHLEQVAENVVGDADSLAPPVVQKITIDDLLQALRSGLDDFTALRSDVIFLCLLYPIIGVFLFWAVFEQNLLPLLGPIVSGFALIGPLCAVGLYEMSRRREKGMDANWSKALEVARSPAFGAIFVLGILLVLTFACWIVAAGFVYRFTMGPEVPASMGAFLMDLVTTAEGWIMAIVGTAIGFTFAVFVLAVSLVSFPLLLDRNVGLRWQFPPRSRWRVKTR